MGDGQPASRDTLLRSPPYGRRGVVHNRRRRSERRRRGCGTRARQGKGATGSCPRRFGITDTVGAFTVSVSESTTGTYSYIARFPGDTTFEDAQSKVVTVTVVVPANVPPTAAFNWVQGTFSVPMIYFDAYASSDSDGEIASYAWDFGDGASLTGMERFPVHNYHHPGTYTVTLTVTDDDGATDSVSHEVKAVGDMPRHQPSPDGQFRLGTEVG